MRQFFLVAFVTLLLAGESYMLITTKSEQDYQKAKDASISLQEEILELSASLRNGEVDKFNQAKADFNDRLEQFAKYSNGSNLYEELKAYQSWLDSAETDRIVEFNESLSEYNRSKAEDIDGQIVLLKNLQSKASYSKTTSDDLAKLLKVMERTRECMSYCFVDDYEDLSAEYEELRTKLDADWEKINSEYSARLRSEALIESLENF